jgi:hypothetical protein
VDNEWDSNWLNIRIDVESERGSWNATDPSLLTGDVEGLARWLDAVAEGRAQEREIDFLEPNLSFELRDESDGGVTLRVWFELESRPSWAPADGASARDLWVDLDVSKRDVRRSASELREHLQTFPPRGIPG